MYYSFIWFLYTVHYPDNIKELHGDCALIGDRGYSAPCINLAPLKY